MYQKIRANSFLKFFKQQWVWSLIAAYLIWHSLIISSDPVISLYNTSRLLEVMLLFLILIDVAKTRKFFKKILYVIFLSGVIQAVISLFQFIFQKSLGLKIFGESVLNPQILGVAKLEVNGEKFIRSYGTFPHPNILGAFLFISLITGLYFFLNKKPTIPFSIPKSLKLSALKSLDKVRTVKIHYIAGLLLILIGILVTFSRSAWLVTALLSVGLLTKYFLRDCFCRKNPTAECAFKSIFKYLIPALVTLLVLFTLFYQFIPARLCPGNCHDQSATLRSEYADFSKQKILRHNLFLGIGMGQFVPVFDCLNPKNLPTYNIQPVHNFYLLAWSEIGLIGIILLGLFAIKNIPNKSFARKNDLFVFLLAGFLILGFFDHYFWSLPQGQFIFWIALALLGISGRINE